MCHWNSELTCLGVIAVVRVFLFYPRICHWVMRPCIFLHHILIYKTQIHLESCQVCIMSLLYLTLHVLHRVRKSRALVRPCDKPVCRDAWYLWLRRIEPASYHPLSCPEFWGSARFFEKYFTNAVCDLCPPRLHCCMFLYTLHYKMAIIYCNYNAQNCVDIIAYGFQFTMQPN
jgi:hypothetical protein